MAKNKFFFGWWMVIAAFFCLAINTGTGYYSFSLFISSLQADFGWSRASIMAAYTIFMILSGVLSPFAGRLVDRYGAGKVITVGAILTGLGFFFLNGVNNPLVFQHRLGYPRDRFSGYWNCTSSCYSLKLVQKAQGSRYWTDGDRIWGGRLCDCSTNRQLSHT